MRLGSGEACELGEDPEETKVLGVGVRETETASVNSDLEESRHDGRQSHGRHPERTGVEFSSAR